MTQEALKLALDALIWTTGSGDFGEGGYAHEGAKKCLFPAITAIKKALAQPEQEPWCMKMNGCKTKCEDCPDKPPQTEQLHASEDVSIGVDVTEDGAHVIALRSYRNGAKVVFYSQFHSAPQRTEHVREAYASIKIRVGDMHTQQFITQEMLHNVDDPWRLITIYAEQCIEELKEKNT